MSQVNLKGLIENFKGRTNVYTPLVEAIVNSIQAIDESKRKDGNITITIKREIQGALALDSEALPEIASVEVQDNGVGFTDQHRDSFDTVYSDLKSKIGGKGFGRFTFHKYFKNVIVKSSFCKDKKYYFRSFNFGIENVIIENEKIEESNQEEDTKTILILDSIKDNKLDKQLETIARKLVENLLIYFIRDDYKCPNIALKEEGKPDEIILNNYLSGEHSEIRQVISEEFQLKKDKTTEKFCAKIFKIYYTRKQSSISLAADNREVTETPLHNYIPEFADEFFEDYKNSVGEKSTRNYTIKSYVIGEYLDKHVSLERGTFEFLKDNDLYFLFSQQDVEKEVAEITKRIFVSEVQTRQKKKVRQINDYVNTKAPWHKPYIDDLDLASVPFHLTDETIELELQKVKFRKEQNAKNEISRILKSKETALPEAMDKLIAAVTEAGKSDLAHYVCSRKSVLDFFSNLLERNDDGSAKYEKEVHNLIFPMGKDSTNTKYDEHNLWLLDERLIFSEYIASDKKISKKSSPTEPDLVIFNQKKSFRNGDNEFSNPLTIFEFKRPKRTDYSQEDDPIRQMGDYLLEIKAGKYETPKGVEKVKVGDNTPVYGYLVCDITERIEYFAEKLHQLKKSPDHEGYFGNLSGYGMLITVISYKKLLKDARMRNAIFFKMLGIEQ